MYWDTKRVPPNGLYGNFYEQPCPYSYHLKLKAINPREGFSQNRRAFGLRPALSLKKQLVIGYKKRAWGSSQNVQPVFGRFLD